MLEHAAVVVSAADEAMAIAKPAASAVRGTLRITLATEVAVGWFPPLLRAFEARYRDVRVLVDAEDTMVALASSDIDIAIRTRFTPKPKSGRSICACLPLELVCAPHKLNLEEDVEDRLNRLGIIGVGDQRRGGRAIEVQGPGEGAFRALKLPVRFAVNNQLVAHRFALEGFGCALLFEDSVRADLEAGRLVPAAPGYQFGFVTCQAIARDKYPSRQAQAFLNFLAENASPETKKPAP